MPVQDSNDKVVLGLAALSVVALLLGLLGWWSWFGVVVWLLIFLCTALGYGRDARRRPIRTVLLALLLVNLSLFIAMLLTDRTEGEPFLILGVPLSTAFLVYGIWPMGTLLGVLYWAMFHRSVLPEEKTEKFLADFGRGASADGKPTN